MYRENETSLVGAVLAAKLARDAKAAVDAAVQLWLTPASGDHTDDAAALDAWNALAELDAIPAAVEAGLRVLRDRRAIRSHAFIDLVEAIPDPKPLAELATLAVDASWPAMPYLAAPIARLAAARPLVVEAWIREHGPRLASDPAAWEVIAFTLVSSSVGKRKDVDAWFERWWERSNVPMWLATAYLTTLWQLGNMRPRFLLEVAERALAHTVPDETKIILSTVLTLEALSTLPLDATLVERIHAHHIELDALFAAPKVELSLVRYANAAKHRRPIQEVDFTFERSINGQDVAFGALAIAAAASSNSKGIPRPPDWRIVDLVQDMLANARRCAKMFPLFVEMFPLKRGNPRAVELAVAMTKCRPSELPRLKPVWARLVKQRVGWLQRLKL